MKTNAQQIVDKQAEDPGLWFVAQTATEEYLQSALRLLHAAVEKDTANTHGPYDCAFGQTFTSDSAKEEEIEGPCWIVRDHSPSLAGFDAIRRSYEEK